MALPWRFFSKEVTVVHGPVFLAAGKPSVTLPGRVNSPAYNAPDLLHRVTHASPAGALREQETAAEVRLLFPDPAPG
jgi:hypothetical protein